MEEGFAVTVEDEDSAKEDAFDGVVEIPLDDELDIDEEVIEELLSVVLADKLVDTLEGDDEPVEDTEIVRAEVEVDKFGETAAKAASKVALGEMVFGVKVVVDAKTEYMSSLLPAPPVEICNQLICHPNKSCWGK